MLDSILQKLPHIDYCESFDFFGLVQPFNVFSNLSFFVASFFIIARLANRELFNVQTATLALLVWGVGLCSTIWHIGLDRFWLLLDIFSIMVLIFSIQCFILRYIFSANIFISLLLPAIFTFASWYLKDATEATIPQSTGGFILSLIFLLAMYLITKTKNYLNAFMVFAVAMVFRVIDMPTCSYTAIGTHWLWHALSALTVYCTVLAIITQLDKKYN